MVATQILSQVDAEMSYTISLFHGIVPGDWATKNTITI